jgi:Na+/proline symporter
MTLATIAVLGAALLLFVWLGLRERHRHTSVDDYVTARNSQGASSLGLSFLASGMGAWILFAPPEVGAFVGPVAVVGYALGAALPFLVFAACGPGIRRLLPEGRSLGEFVRVRYGRGLHLWVTLLAVLYMLCFLAAELTAVGAITALLSDVPAALAVIGVAVTTLIYTAWGGLRASLVTDRWQALLLLALLALVATVAATHLPRWPALSELPAAPMPDALAVAATLIIAVTAANLFHQGYWQRVWAARSGSDLGRGALLGAVTTVIAVLIVGGLGVIGAASGLPLGQPPMPFFALLSEASDWLALPALLLAVTLVASSVDTLENGLASLAVARRGGASLAAARWLTVLLMVPVVIVALQGLSVLRLFLIADLLCATAVVPMLLGLWSRMTAAAAVAGCLAGLVGAVLPGWVDGGSVGAGLLAASFPGGIPTLGPFAGALLGSTLVSVLVALAGPRPVAATS